MKKLFFIVYGIFHFLIGFGQQCPIIPLPAQYSLVKDEFLFSPRTVFVGNGNMDKNSISYFQNRFREIAGFPLKTKKSTKDGNKIVLVYDTHITSSEAYFISMNKDSILIKSRDPKGLFHGMNSVLQLALAGQKKQNGIVTRCWDILDHPAYTWRGYMLDESRHFFGKAVVRKLLDAMAFYKMNRFHWHLTDETGWRIEIKKYHNLTAIGARGDFSDSTKAPQYYTQKDIKEIVRYALDRGIDIIPEIDMPGHASAANRAYPQYSGGGSVKHPDFTFNPGYDATYTYLTDILKEIVGLFPSKMLHIGGDEVSFGNEKWTTDSAILQLKKREHLISSLDVEHYFIRRMADSVSKLGCKLLGWDEIADIKLKPATTIVFWWRHDHKEQLQKALGKGFQVVLCPRLPFYFDFVQSNRDRMGRRWSGAFNRVQDVHDFVIDSLHIQSGQRNQIIGLQAAMWTEQVSSASRLYYMTFPRMAAFAENAWHAGTANDFKGFENRLQPHWNYWQKKDFSYFDYNHPGNTPEIQDKKVDIQYLDKAVK